jgi:putative transposase
MTKFTRTYPTDLQYSEWLLIEQFFPARVRGRPRKWEMWLILNAILYVTRTGCQWRMLPTNFPPWQTVYGYLWRWTRSGLWAQLNAVLVQCVRQQAGRHPQPSAAVIDSQSVKTSEGGEARGVDVFKQTRGRKRHIVVDTLGLLLLVMVHSASLQDTAGGQLVLQRLFEQLKHNVHNRWCRLELIWADGGYENLVASVRQQFGWQLEIVRRPVGSKGFIVLPRRWVVERTFGWFGRYRRLARDYEHTVSVSEAMTYIASIRRMLKLLTI